MSLNYTKAWGASVLRGQAFGIFIAITISAGIITFAIGIYSQPTVVHAADAAAECGQYQFKYDPTLKKEVNDKKKEKPQWEKCIKDKCLAGKGSAAGLSTCPNTPGSLCKLHCKSNVTKSGTITDCCQLAPNNGCSMVDGKCGGELPKGGGGMMPMMGMMMPMMGGMPPMLPMIPMGGGDMPMPMMPGSGYCPPKTKPPENTSTTSSSTPERASSTPSLIKDHSVIDPNCIEGPFAQGGQSSSYWFPDSGGSQSGSGSGGSSGFGSEDNGSSGSGSIWARLMETLGIGSDDDGSGVREQEEFGYSATGTGRVTSQGRETQGRGASTTYDGRFVGGQTFVTYDLSEQARANNDFTYRDTDYEYQGAADTFVSGTALILNNIRTALLRLLAILMALINNR